ncbi:MAG TPA: LamG-like jellyroll fold domain-containing protein, partial [Verrucomicrobiae bacterium]
HRYSFNETSGLTAVDSIGGANATLQGTAAFDAAGNVVLDGSSGCYVSLPAGVLNNLTAVTFETWLTNSTSPDNVCQFSFDSGAGTGGSYLRHVIHDQSNGRNQFEMTAGGNSNLQGYPGFGGQSIHVVCVYDPTTLVQQVFTNGVLAASKTGAALPSLSGLWSDAGALGRSPWWAYGDPYLAGSINEFRIYSGRLLADEIAASDIAGPNTVLTTNVSMSASASGGNATLAWPVASPGFTLYSSPTLGAGAVWTLVTNGVSIVGENYQVSVPRTGGTKFFRLKR